MEGTPLVPYHISIAPITMDSTKHTISTHVVPASQNTRHSSIIAYIRSAHDSVRFGWGKKHHTYDVPTEVLLYFYIIIAIKAAACISKRFPECPDVSHIPFCFYRVNK